MEELLLLTQKKDYKECSAICFTETWLNNNIPDAAVTPPGYSIYRCDRTAKTGGGVCFLINHLWCTNSTIISQSCSPDLEYISIKCRPFYLPREFASIMLTGVYIQPRANATDAIRELARHISYIEQSQPDSTIIALGDFNHTNLSRELPNYKQQVKCPTRGPNILDHCYSTIKSAYRAFPRARLGKSDHAMLLLIPSYRQKLKTEKPTIKSRLDWTHDAVETLKGCLDCTLWDSFKTACSSLDEYTSTVTSYIQFCVETCIPTKTVRSFGNSKPWFNKELAALRKKKNSAYLSGDKEAYKSAKYQLRSAIKKAKSIHSKKLEDQFKENNTREVWKNIQQLTNYKNRSPPAADEDPDLPNKLNQFYARFDTANHFTSPGPPPPPPSPPPPPPCLHHRRRQSKDTVQKIQ